MRRKDRQVKDEKAIDQIISKCKIIRLGFYDEEEVYIVPLNFGFEKEGQKRIFYFHGAKQGRKIDLVKKYGHAGFEMDTDFEITKNEDACEYSANFKSIIGRGKISVLEDEDEKLKAMNCLMRFIGAENFEIDKKSLSHTAVIKMEVEELSCKVKNE